MAHGMLCVTMNDVMWQEDTVLVGGSHQAVLCAHEGG